MSAFAIFVLFNDGRSRYPRSITLPVSSYNRTMLRTVLTVQSMLTSIVDRDMF